MSVTVTMIEIDFIKKMKLWAKSSKPHKNKKS
jgi:hypothetical protein